jgi:hypothetical protein
VREHRFAEEHAADAQPVQAADQSPVHPGLDALHEAAPRQRRVGLLHLRHDPGTGLALARGGGAGRDHGRCVMVDAQFATGKTQEAANRLLQRRVQLEVLHLQHHARVGAPPQQGLALAVPGKDAEPIGRQQALGPQVATDRQQPWRLAVGAHRLGGVGEGDDAGMQTDNHALILDSPPCSSSAFPIATR